MSFLSDQERIECLEETVESLEEENKKLELRLRALEENFSKHLYTHQMEKYFGEKSSQ